MRADTVHYTQLTKHCTLLPNTAHYTLNTTMYTVHSSLNIVHWYRKMLTTHCSLSRYTVHFSQLSAHCTLPLCTIHCTELTTHCPCTLYTAHSYIYTIHFHCTLPCRSVVNTCCILLYKPSLGQPGKMKRSGMTMSIYLYYKAVPYTTMDGGRDWGQSVQCMYSTIHTVQCTVYII